MRNIRRRGKHDGVPLADQLKVDEEIAYIHVREQPFLVISATVIGFKPYHFASHKIPQKFTRVLAIR